MSGERQGPLKPFEKGHISDELAIRKLQERIERFTSQVEQHEAFNDTPFGCPIIKGVRVDGASLASGASTRIEHTLGRTPVGWFIIDTTTAPNKFCNIYRTAWDADSLSLYNTDAAAIVVDLWVF